MHDTHRTDPKAYFLAQRGALHPHPQRVQDALFRGCTFFDPRDLVQVRYEMVRRFRVNGHPASAVARSFGVSRQSLYALARAFQGRGLPGLFPGKRGPKAPSKCPDVVLAFVQARLDESPGLTSDELLHDVRQRLGLHLHRRTLQRQRQRLGKKRCRPTRPRRGTCLRPSTWPHATSACGPWSSCAARPIRTRRP
jgi:transposase